jgi:hypothetical protein
MAARYVKSGGTFVELGGGGPATDFGVPVRNGSTTPKDPIGVNVDLGAGTVNGTITFGQTDPNGGTWGALYDGTTGFLSLASRFAFGTAFSFSVWVKTTSTDATSGYAGNPANVIFGDHTNSIAFAAGVHDGKWEARRFNGSVWQTVTHPTPVNDGTWKFCAMSYVGGALLMYVASVDSAVAELHTGSVSSGVTGGIDRIGAGYLNGTGNQDFFNGSLYRPTFYQNWLWKPHPVS